MADVGIAVGGNGASVGGLDVGVKVGALFAVALLLGVQADNTASNVTSAKAPMAISHTRLIGLVRLLIKLPFCYWVLGVARWRTQRVRCHGRLLTTMAPAVMTLTMIAAHQTTAYCFTVRVCYELDIEEG